MSDKINQEVIRGYVVDQLENAIEKGYIKAYYQPVIRTLTGEICSMEALARWDDPHYGLLSPAVFIPVLEDAQLIHKLDICIIESICKHYAGLVRLKRKIVPVSFNLSRLDFQLCDIHSIIENAILDNKLPRDIFHVEITESMMDSGESRMHEALDCFWDSGLRVWMDDFGSGYSSLNVLKDYHFDTLKIDMLFMRDFDARSKEIIRSVVDMSKRIGVHTLAEGVETAEQLHFLRSIGCEKAQGFYIGKPLPYDECIEHLRAMQFPMESQSKKQYYHDIGSINMLSPTPLTLATDGNAYEPIMDEGQIPFAIIEVTNRKARYLFANDHYIQTLNSVGISSTNEVEELYEKNDVLFGKKCRYLFRKAKDTKQIETANFVRNGEHCFVQVRHVSDFPGGSAYACILQNISSDGNVVRDNLLAGYAGDLFALYEDIEVIDLMTGYSQNIYRSTQFTESYNRFPTMEELEHFAVHDVYPEDRERFRTFMDMTTIEDRLDESHMPFISAPFRILTADGNYIWHLNVLLYAGNRYDRKILCCSRLIDNDSLKFLWRAAQDASERNARQNAFAAGQMDENEITSAVLWKNLVQNSSVMFFWKDRDRKFRGASRSFLDYYGLREAEELIGKDDEEMGWHVDPAPYKTDEELVLESGIRTRDVAGHCLNNGEVRDIIASKMPIYDDGKIVGLMGTFRDVTQTETVLDVAGEQGRRGVETVDAHTGMLNFLGLFNVMLQYQESYQKQNIDFGLIYLNIENFREYNENHGVDWGDALLKTVGQALRKYVGINGVVARYSGDHFMVLAQCQMEEDLMHLLKRLEDGVRSIKSVDRIPCTVYFKKGIARYSEVHDLHALYNLAEERSRI